MSELFQADPRLISSLISRFRSGEAGQWIEFDFVAIATSSPLPLAGEG